MTTGELKTWLKNNNYKKEDVFNTFRLKLIRITIEVRFVSDYMITIKVIDNTERFEGEKEVTVLCFNLTKRLFWEYDLSQVTNMLVAFQNLNNWKNDLGGAK